MFEVKHIVVGSDGSPEGSDALVLGAALASVSGATLDLVGVFSLPLLLIPNVSEGRALRRATERALGEQRRQFAPTALVRTVADRSYARALGRFAQRARADIVVIGSSRHAPAGRCEIGRHSRQLLSEAPFALAIAKRGLHRTGAELQSIGVGYEGGPESATAAAFASALSRAASAQLRVLTVAEDSVPAFTAAEWMAVGSDWDSLRSSRLQKAREEAEELAADLPVRSEVLAAVGDPGTQLREWSDDVDLTVVGSRRWGAIARLVSGSVGETLVSDAGSSVLIVPRPTADKHRARRQPTLQGAHN
ncbi:MAG TPA: universal stress protein, partial [Mycobacteriales bacterium]|nr:universal stress protein [Mycobacteriales bacterium]